MGCLDDYVAISAKHAAARLLDAFYLEGQVLTEAEYAPLRDALRVSVTLLPGDSHRCSPSARVNDSFGGTASYRQPGILAAELTHVE